ncbi:hypothetical protein [Magnetospirillum aberrantis]|uniref:PBP domain-containing protein n=1 Tax=Magnetospirillum aberrantis SpK TaxID=908842 RepID=A0A7C9QS10_9PROT|nr:hypothetical protein [Magnetospirillum aberrantis]NFV79044.1 hypothetical protein [Magnetospirillum aberrantis SpK]
MAQRPTLRFLRRVALVVAVAGWPVAGATAWAAEMTLVATASMAPYGAVLAERLRQRMPDPPVIAATDNVAVAVERFCVRGAGVDGLLLHRALNRRERQHCTDVGVEPVALALGVEAAVVAVPQGSVLSRMTLDALFAVAIREVSVEGRNRINTVGKWREADATHPDEAMILMVPADGAARALFDDRAMQSACRKLPGMQAIYSAAERSRRCTALRQDGIVREYDGAAALDQALAEPSPGLVTIMSSAAFAARASRLTALPVEGVVPDDDSISDESYPLSRRVYLYLRKPDSRHQGAADRHRLAMVADAASHEEAVGPGGAFAAAGLVPLPLAARGEQRAAVLKRLTGDWP